MSEIPESIELDTLRLLCPLPLIRLQNKIKQTQKGHVIHVLCSDPGTLYDIPAWCQMFGHHILQIKEEEELIQFWVKVM